MKNGNIYKYRSDIALELINTGKAELVEDVK